MYGETFYGFHTALHQLQWSKDQKYALYRKAANSVVGRFDFFHQTVAMAARQILQFASISWCLWMISFGTFIWRFIQNIWSHIEINANFQICHYKSQSTLSSQSNQTAGERAGRKMFRNRLNFKLFENVYLYKIVIKAFRYSWSLSGHIVFKEMILKYFFFYFFNIRLATNAIFKDEFMWLIDDYSRNIK